MLDSLVRVSRRDRQTTQVLGYRFLSRAKIPPTDNQHAQHATVTRPHIIRTLLARSIDRVKRLLAINSTTTKVFGNQGSKTQSAFADTQHLKYHLSCT